jgi:hypothetical protein
MTMIAPGSTAESRTAALAMFEGQVPCMFQLIDPSCPHTARWLVQFVHEEATARCDRADPWPVCDEHKRMIQMSSHPFWRTWHQMAPVPCPACQSPLRLERFESL